MVTFGTADIASIARLSGLDLSIEEQEAFARQLAEILTYTQQLENVSQQITAEPATTNVNEFREDKVVEFPNEKILENAPQTEDNAYFVVPRILQH